LNEAREKSEEIIDDLYSQSTKKQKKPRTYVPAHIKRDRNKGVFSDYKRKTCGVLTTIEPIK
jgi:hypothetical protein